MATIVLYHHVLGLTPGVRALADALATAGQTVLTPDLFDGRTFASIDEGMTFVRSQDQDHLAEIGIAAALEVTEPLVVAGISYGAMVAGMVASRRPVAGMLSLESFVDPSWVGGWSRPVPLQIHAMEQDPFFLEDEEAARAWVAEHDDAELFTYPGDQHLFTDANTPAHAAGLTAIVIQRSLAFVEQVSG